MIDSIGLLAAILTTISFLPQTIMVIRTGKTEGISATMYAMFTLGAACWLAYGVMLNSLPIMFANTITLGLAATILGLKLRSVLRDRRKAMAL